MDSSALLLGNVIGARYRIEALLGEGGMAVVFQARHTSTGKLCALKLIRSHLVSRPELLDMFVREAQIAGRIGEHPNIVNVYDAGVDQARKLPFIAMELLQGQTLERYVDAHGHVPADLFRAIIEQLGDGLEQAHRAGVIHRDLKPGNLFLSMDRRGQPVLKIMDFGIAKVLEQGAHLTATHIGSPAYAAPEQQSGSVFRKVAASQGITIAQGVSPATDVWAVGLLAYELLTGLSNGQYWAAAESAPNDLLMKITLGETELPSARAGERAGLLPPGFDGWFERCLRKNAVERFPSVGEAVQALLTLLPPPRATSPSFAEGLPPTRAMSPSFVEGLPPLRAASDAPPRATSDEPPRAGSQPGGLAVNTLEMATARQSRPAIALQGSLAAAMNQPKPPPPPPAVAAETSGDWTKTARAVHKSRLLAVVGVAATVTVVLMSGLLWFLLGDADPASTTPSAATSTSEAKPAARPTSPPRPTIQAPASVPGDTPDPGVKQGAAKAMLKVRAAPVPCRVSVDDVAKGVTPLDMEVRPGVYVVACKTLADSQQQAVVVKSGADAQVDFDTSP